jgi:hypothetical protein
MPLWNLLYEGIGEQLGYTVENLLKELNAGRAPRSAGLAFGKNLIRPLPKFLPASALGAPSLVDMPFQVESRTLSPKVLSRMAQSLPFREPEYQNIFGPGGYAERAGIPPSSLGRLSKTGQPLEVSLYHRIETTPLLVEPPPEIEGGVYREPGSLRVADPSIWSSEPVVRLAPRKMKSTNTPYYQATLHSIQRSPAYSQSLREVAMDAASESPSEKGQELRDWIIKIAGMNVGDPTDAAEVAKRVKFANEVLANLQGPQYKQAFGLTQLIEQHPELGRTALWQEEELPNIVRLTHPWLPKALIHGSDVSNLVLSQELSKIKGITAGPGRPATLPARTQKALMLGVADEFYGEGAANVIPALMGWIEGSEGAAANGTRHWWERTFGRLPSDEGQLLMDMLHLSHAISGGEGLRGLRLMNRGLMQGMLRMYLDDVAAQAIPTANTPALRALYRKLGTAFMGAKPGTLIGAGATFALLGMFLSQTDFMPKAEAAELPPGVGRAVGEAFARTSSRAAGSAVGEPLDQALGNLWRRGSSGSFFQEFGKMARSLMDFVFTSDEALFQDQVGAAAGTIDRPEIRTSWEQHAGEIMQRMSASRNLELGIRNDTTDIAGRWVELAREDGIQLPLWTPWGKNKELLAWTQTIRRTMRQGPQYFRTLTPRQRQAAIELRQWYNGIYQGAQDAGGEIRPYRLNYFTYAFDPNKVETFLQNPALIDRLVAEDLPKREQELMQLARGGPGYTRFLEEVQRSLGTQAVADIRQAIREHPEAFRTIVRGVAKGEIHQFLATLQARIRAPGLSRTMEEMVHGEMSILPGLPSGIGDLGVERLRPAFRSPFFTNPQRLPTWLADLLEYEDPLASIVTYGEYGARHIAAAKAWGPKGETLKKYLGDMVEMRNFSYDPQRLDNALLTLRKMFVQRTGREPDVLSRAGRALIPATIISRMQLTMVPHFFQNFDAAAVTSLKSFTKAGLEITGGSREELDKLVSKSGNLVSFSLAWDLGGARSGSETAIERASNLWLQLIQFKRVRRLLTEMGAMSGHYEMTDRLRAITAATTPQEAAAKVIEGRKWLNQVGFGRRITLESDVKMLEELLTDYKAGKIVDDPRAMARMARFETPTGMWRDPYLRTMNVVTNLVAQNFNPWEFPGSWNTPLGRIFTLFRRFFYLQTRNVVSMALHQAREGNFGPLFTLAVPYTASGAVLMHARSYLRGKPAPTDDPRQHPLVIGGMRMPDGFQKYLEYEMSGGAFGLGEELYRAMLAPNQPYLGVVGLITGLLPLEFVQMSTTGAEALGDLLKYGPDPVRTRDFANARRFFGMWVNMVPFLGGRAARQPPFVTGRAWYLQRKKEGIDAYLGQDYDTYVRIQMELQQEQLPDITPSDLAAEIQRRQSRARLLQTRPPLAGQPSYQQYRQTGTYPGMPDQPVELPPIPGLSP